MSRKWLSILALIAAATFFVNLSSCGFNQHLVSIQIAPTNVTFGGVVIPPNPPLFVDFAATGTYEHPPKTIDITNIVTWGTDSPQVVLISSAGVATTSTNCGTANISASFYDSPNLVSSNSATIVVDGPAADGCTPAGPPPTLSVQVTATTATSGTVASNPAGISCTIGSTCSGQFPAGTAVTLTATPATSFKDWTSGCSQTNGNTCTVFLQNDTTVVATFD
jgi:hypothetical protein